jgi:hypothetical protein
MGPLTEAEMTTFLAGSAQVKKYAQAVDRESAREILERRVGSPAIAPTPESDAPAPGRVESGRREVGTFEQILKSPVTRTVVGTITRGLMGAILGTPRRRRPRF